MVRLSGERGGEDSGQKSQEEAAVDHGAKVGRMVPQVKPPRGWWLLTPFSVKGSFHAHSPSPSPTPPGSPASSARSARRTSARSSAPWPRAGSPPDGRTSPAPRTSWAGVASAPVTMGPSPVGARRCASTWKKFSRLVREVSGVLDSGSGQLRPATPPGGHMNFRPRPVGNEWTWQLREDDSNVQ
jgi:hypothetical protein